MKNCFDHHAEENHQRKNAWLAPLSTQGPSFSLDPNDRSIGAKYSFSKEHQLGGNEHAVLQNSNTRQFASLEENQKCEKNQLIIPIQKAILYILLHKHRVARVSLEIIFRAKQGTIITKEMREQGVYGT